MPEKRMIWKAVSTSRKVTKLSLKAALLWTWCIPHFDVAGYLEVEPDDLKYKVMQRRSDVKEDEIRKLVDEIILSRLWLRCKTKNGTQVVFDPKFCDMQKVRREQEAPSKWENKCEIMETITEQQQNNNSGKTEVPPPKLIKVNVSKVSVREFVTLSQDDNEKLSKRFSKDKLEWCFDKLNFWVSTKKKKVVNGYAYFNKGSWLIEEMEKKFNPKGKGYIAQAQGPDLKAQQERDDYLKKFKQKDLDKRRQDIGKLGDILPKPPK